MDFPVAQLFDFFLATPDPVALPELQTLLNISPNTESAEQFQVAMDGLVKLGFLESTDQGFRRRSDSTLVPGRLRCYNKGYCFAIRDEADVDDVYIYASNLNGAWNGDRVLTRVTKDGYRKRSPEGEVAAVIERVNLTLVARIQNSETAVKAIPLDDRLLFEVELPETPPGSLNDGQVVYIEVIRYPLANLLTQGRVIKVLGSDPGYSMDVDLICSKYALPQTFADSVIQAAQDLPKTISKAELKKRQDLRDWFTLTLATQDLQSLPPTIPAVAFSLRATEGDHWQLGVHLADVAALISLDSPLANEARLRCQTAQLDAVTLPLYPPEVGERLTLTPQQERLTLSVLVTLTASGMVVDYQLQPSVIRTSAHLTYAQVEALLATELGETPSDLLLVLHQLHHLTQQCRAQRHTQGGFTVPLSGLPAQQLAPLSRGALVLAPNPVQPMVQECLILVEALVAQHLLILGIPAVGYDQSTPAMETLHSFFRLATTLNLGITPSEAETIPSQDIEQWCQQLPMATPAGAILSEQLLTALAGFSYQPLSPNPAFALALPAAPLTAPLQRYSDLVNQHVLHTLFQKGKEKSAPRSKTVADIRHSSSHSVVSWAVLPAKNQEELSEAVSTWLTDGVAQLLRIRQAEQELWGLKKSAFMQSHLGETLTGVIVRVQNYGFFVQVEPLLAEGLVHVRSLKDDWYEFHPKYQALIGRKNRKQFRLGERVDVQVKSVDYYRQQTDLIVLGEGQVFEGDEL
ncbi:MAG: ribonuclease R [Synechococcales cyanobacterium]